jgi:hypothetical protein
MHAKSWKTIFIGPKKPPLILKAAKPQLQKMILKFLKHTQNPIALYIIHLRTLWAGFRGLSQSLHPTPSHVRYCYPSRLGFKIPACIWENVKCPPLRWPLSLPPALPWGLGGGGVGCRVEMCVINLPTPKIGQLLQMGGGGGEEFPLPHPYCNVVVNACRLSGLYYCFIFLNSFTQFLSWLSSNWTFSPAIGPPQNPNVRKIDKIIFLF